MLQPTKIIFLDIDGVLNTRTEETPRSAYPILDRCMKNLNILVRETEAKVVVSSSWRILFEIPLYLERLLKEKGFEGTILDFTPYINNNYCVRGNEIKKWILENIHLLNVDYYFNFHSYVILDDEDDMLLEQKDNFVQTNGLIGLDISALKKSKNILLK